MIHLSSKLIDRLYQGIPDLKTRESYRLARERLGRAGKGTER